MNWTDERVSLLKRLWGEGHTAAEIAKVLGGGVSRNAVIGKAHRLKLSNRVSPIQQNKKPPQVKPATRKIEKSVSVISAAPSFPVVPAKNKEDLFDLTDLKARMCRWPMGDPKEEDFGFCGDPIIASLPYCSTHAKVAYQSATRNRILQAESLEAEHSGNEAAQDFGQRKRAG